MTSQSEVFHAYSEIPIDAAQVPWETGSPSLWSLLDMLKTYGFAFYTIATNLSSLSVPQFPKDEATETLSDSHKVEIGKILREL